MRRLLYSAAFCSLACLAFAGCGEGGPELGRVTGTVTMDGDPLPNALVTFVPQEGGRASTGVTNENGEYELIYQNRKGALLGQHKVTVTTMRQAEAAPEMSSDSEEYMKQATGGDPSQYDQVFEEKIPPRYNKDSELVEEVQSGSNEIDLELTSGAS